MLATVATVVGTQDLAKGVLVGVLLSGIFFAGKVSKLFHVHSTLSADGTERTYHVDGQIFFASAESFITAFDFTEPLRKVTIQVADAHLWDITAVGALDKVVLKYRRLGLDVSVTGVNEASANMLYRFALHDKERPVFASQGNH
jgi:SulP family sulfate permease